MIVHIRSTSGGGKTTAMRALMQRAGVGPPRALPLQSGATTVIQAGQWQGNPFYVIGPYDKPGTGGCDRIKLVSDVVRLVQQLAGARNSNAIVAFEGLLLAHSWGQMGETLHPMYRHRYYNFFLDTPRETCIANVLQRRLNKGDTNPPDRVEKITKNIEADYYRVELAHKRVLTRGGNRVDVNWVNSGAEIASHIDAWCEAKKL